MNCVQRVKGKRAVVETKGSDAVDADGDVDMSSATTAAAAAEAKTEAEDTRSPKVRE